MGIISLLLLGLVIGMLAKWIMPGRDPGGLIVTILLGIAGAFIGGFMGTFLGFGPVTGFNFTSLVLGVIGALMLLYAYRLIRDKT